MLQAAAGREAAGDVWTIARFRAEARASVRAASAFRPDPVVLFCQVLTAVSLGVAFPARVLYGASRKLTPTRAAPWA